MQGLEAGEGGGAGAGAAGLRLLLQFDPGRPGLDRTLLGFSLSAVLGRLLGWGGSAAGRRASVVAIAGEAEGGGGDSGSAAVSAAALAAAVSLSLAAMYVADHRPRGGARRRRLPAPSSAARQRALPAPDDGLRIVSSKGESLENVIHGASVGAGDDDDEPAIVARVESTQAVNMPRAKAAADGTEDDDGRPEEERRELARVRELWLSLLEREQRLELRLQELERLREQEAAVRELEGRAAAAAAEERLLQLRVAALQEENGRLRAQAEELDAARADLARAKEKLRAAKARARAEQEEARREAAALQARAAELESGGEERAAALGVKADALRKANAALEVENLELALRLQDAEQAAASSVNLVHEEDMVEEARDLRETKERLTREIEQLRNDHCAHVEELVYLKWVNACLRHELSDRDGHPPPFSAHHHDAADANGGAGVGGLLSAMDLSKSMSFRSSERAKQLMLRYGHPGLDGFDPALFSPLHESVDGDGEERMRAHHYGAERSPSPALVAPTMDAAADAMTGSKKAGPRKLKFLGNIKKLLPGGKRSHPSSGHGRREASRKAPAPAPSDEYLEKAMRWLSTHDVLDGDHSYESTPLSSCDRTPLSSVTTATTRDSRVARGGGGGVRSERGGTPAAEAVPAPATLARSKSDAGASYGREAGRYHALRPDHPTGADGFRAPEKRGDLRRRSEEVRSTE